jgi:hypothetical protein
MIIDSDYGSFPQSLLSTSKNMVNIWLRSSLKPIQNKKQDRRQASALLICE